MDLEELLRERGERYGDFTALATVAQAIKALARSSRFDDVQREGYDMIAVKLARLVCGDPDHVDSWDDIAGFAKLVADWLRAAKKG